MAKQPDSCRSLKVRPDKIAVVKAAFEASSYQTQEELAKDEEVKCSRGRVCNFLNGQKISRKLFDKIYDALYAALQDVHIGRVERNDIAMPGNANLETWKGWATDSNTAAVQAISTPIESLEPIEPLESTEPLGLDIDPLVQEARQKVRGNVEVRCGTMRVLDMEYPIGVGDIYTRVNILDKISGRQRLDIETLPQANDLENFDRFELGNVQQKRLPALEVVEKYAKLMILGKPGAGKTTFLKRLAMLCSSDKNQFQSNRVPIFITLKDFAEAEDQSSLQPYIAARWAQCGISKNEAAEIAKRLLHKGRALVLLDGLDEVRETDHDRVIKDIKNFTIQFHNCQFVITCRIAAPEYIFESFTEVELAEFSKAQIEEFAKKWFLARQSPDKTKTFMQKLQTNKPIQELATNPLLLTLLCLVFEARNDFPTKRSGLYQEGVEILLQTWDAKRNIKRDHQIYRNLSLTDKQGLLRQIAFQTFDNGEYFFEQQDIEKKILNYIKNLPDANIKPAATLEDSEAVLKAIEAQHGLLVERARGIYSFSHLTFQEYFTAEKIVNTPPSQSLKDFERLSGHITKKSWREVFLLAVEMLCPADDLLKAMKAEVDKILAGDEKLQQLLAWVQEKSESMGASYKPAAVRTFYFALAVALDLDRDCDRDRALDLVRDRDLVRNLAHARARARDLDLARALARARDLARDLVRDLAHARDLARDLDLDLALARALAADQELEQSIIRLHRQLPDQKSNFETRREWWESNGETWAEDLRKIMITHRNIGHAWDFNPEQKEKLQQYYDANRFLVECLDSRCNVTPSVQAEIKDTLLLPVAGIET